MDAGGSPFVGSLALLGETSLVRGVNLTVEPNTGSWDVFWSTAWNWETWVKPQIDRSAALGANTIRCIGTASGVLDGLVSRPTYLARWEQMAAHVNSLGMRLYPCGTGEDPTVIANDSALADELVALADALAPYDPIGFDMVQERPIWAEDITRGGVVAGVVASAQPDLPLAFSWSITSADSVNHLHRFARLRQYTDFADIHVYRDDLTASAFDAYWAHETNPLLIGEFGQNVAAGQAAQESRYNLAKVLVDHASPHGNRLAGALAWAAADQGTADVDKWGMWDNAGTARTYLTDIWSTFPTTA